MAKLADDLEEYYKTLKKPTCLVPSFIHDIEPICKVNNFDKDVVESAKEIFSKIMRYDAKIVDALATTFVAVYLACKNQGIKITLEEIYSKAYHLSLPHTSRKVDINYQEKERQEGLERTKNHLKEIQMLMPKIKKKYSEQEKEYKNSEISEINYIVSANNLTDVVAKKARQIFNNSCHLSKGELCGTFPQACVYLACQSFASTRNFTLEEIDIKAYPLPDWLDQNKMKKNRGKTLDETRILIKKIKQNKA